MNKLKDWRVIPNFPNYEINKLGEVRHIRFQKILKHQLNKFGYLHVALSNKTKLLHRLLAETFISNPNNLQTVNHKDGNKLNNDISNLEWMTLGDNVRHYREVLKLPVRPYSNCWRFVNSEQISCFYNNQPEKLLH